MLLAARQGGAVSFAQARELGFPPATIQRRVESGAWRRVQTGVYLVGAAPAGRMRDLWVAALAVGPAARITHESAGLVHGAERLRAEPITLTVPHRWHHRVPGTFVHQIDDLAPHHTMRWNGLVVSTPARVVIELGATQPVDVIGRVADDFLRMHKTTIGQLAAVFTQVARPGKPGMERVARVLDERGDGYVPPQSVLERALFDVLAAGGLPPPVRQLPLPGRGRVPGIADGGYLDAKIVLEADGRRWHDRIQAARQDRERDAEAARVGWQTLRFLHEQTTHDPGWVVGTVRDTREVRLALLRRAA